MEGTMTNIKRTAHTMAALACLVLFIGLSPVGYLFGHDGYEEPFSKTVSVSSGAVKLVLRNVSGDIDVKTWNRSEIKIEATKRSSASAQSEAKENAALVKIEVTQEDHTVRIETKYPESSHSWFSKSKSIDVSVDYTLTIPDSASTDIHSVSGNIDISNCEGESWLETVSGDVKATAVGGHIRAKSISGLVDVSDARQGADCESISGNVTVRQVGGDTRAKAISGDVTVEHSKGSVTAESLSGNVVVYERPDAGFDFEASTFSGDINTEFELRVLGHQEHHELRGSINGGGKSINVKCFSGNVDLKKK